MSRIQQQAQSKKQQILENIANFRLKLEGLLQKSSIPLLQVSQNNNYTIYSVFHYYAYITVIYLKLAQTFHSDSIYTQQANKLDVYGLVFRVLRKLFWPFEPVRIGQVNNLLQRLDAALGIDTNVIRLQWLSPWSNIEFKTPSQKEESQFVQLFKISDLLELFLSNSSNMNFGQYAVCMQPITKRIADILIIYQNRQVAQSILLLSTKSNSIKQVYDENCLQFQQIYLSFILLLHQSLIFIMYHYMQPEINQRNTYVQQYSQLNLLPQFKQSYNKFLFTYKKMMEINPNTFRGISLKITYFENQPQKTFVTDLQQTIVLKSLKLHQKQVLENFRQMDESLVEFKRRQQQIMQAQDKNLFQAEQLHQRAFQTSMLLLRLSKTMMPANISWQEDLTPNQASRQQMYYIFDQLVNIKIRTKNVPSQQVNSVLYLTSRKNVAKNPVQFLLYFNVIGAQVSYPSNPFVTINMCIPDVQSYKDSYQQLKMMGPLIKTSRYSEIAKEIDYVHIQQKSIIETVRNNIDQIWKLYAKAGTSIKSLTHSILKTTYQQNPLGVVLSKSQQQLAEEEIARIVEGALHARKLTEGIQSDNSAFPKKKQYQNFWAKYVLGYNSVEMAQQLLKTQYENKKKYSADIKKGTQNLKTYLDALDYYGATWARAQNQENFNNIQNIQKQLIKERNENYENALKTAALRKAMLESESRLSKANKKIKSIQDDLNELKQQNSNFKQQKILKIQQKIKKDEDFVNQNSLIEKILSNRIQSRQVFEQLSKALKSLLKIEKQPLQAFKKLFGFITKIKDNQPLLDKLANIYNGFTDLTSQDLKKHNVLSDSFVQTFIATLQQTQILAQIRQVSNRYHFNKKLIAYNINKKKKPQLVNFLQEQNYIIEQWLGKVQQVYNKWVTTNLKQDAPNLKVGNILDIQNVKQQILSKLSNPKFLMTKTQLQVEFKFLREQFSQLMKQWKQTQKQELIPDKDIIDQLSREIDEKIRSDYGAVDIYALIKDKITGHYLQKKKVQQHVREANQYKEYAKCLVQNFFNSFAQLWKYGQIFQQIIKFISKNTSAGNSTKRQQFFKQIQEAFTQNVLKQGFYIIACKTQHIQKMAEQILNSSVTRIQKMDGVNPRQIQEIMNYIRQINSLSTNEVKQRIRTRQWR